MPEAPEKAERPEKSRKASATPKPPRDRAQSIAKAIGRMPLGALRRTADALVVVDGETARYFHDQLGQALTKSASEE